MMLTCLHTINLIIFFFFFNDTATTEIYTLSLHDALPILDVGVVCLQLGRVAERRFIARRLARSEEHTSELQSPCNLVCRLLLEKKKNSPCRLRCVTEGLTRLRRGGPAWRRYEDSV